jgi:putative OmpL-like beta-barrel porin-2
MRKPKSILGLISALLIIALNGGIVSAQQPQSTDSAETVELRSRIKRLEERLEKLEVEKGKNSTNAIAGATAATNPTATPETQSTPPKDNGVLDFFKEIEVSGFIDGYYGYNFNKPSGSVNLLRNFDTRHNQFALNLAEIVIEKKPDPFNSRVGFRLDLDYGPATDLVHAAEPGGRETYKVIQQAYGSYLVPFGSGLQIDVGKFVTWNGAEVIETKDNWNYSRGLLFAWAIPYYHAGVRAKYALNSKVSLMGAVVNGWNNVEENNSGKTFGLSLALTPTTKLSIIQNYTTGPEQANDRRHYRHLSDTIVTYNFNDKWAVMGNYDYAIDTLTSGGKVHWQGVAAYLRYAPTKRLAFIPRFEWFDDHDGFSTGTAQRLKEFTMTSEFRMKPTLLTRVEFRHDRSNQPFFPKSDPTVLVRSQSTLLAGLIWTFSTRGQ